MTNDNQRDDEGIQYTGGDYDPREIDTGSREYYAYSETDYIDTTLPTNGPDDEKTVFERNENVRDQQTSLPPGQENPVPTRAKEAILHDIQERFVEDTSLDAARIKVTVNDSGEVILDGAVEQPAISSRYEEAVQDIPGVTRVTNRLLIQPAAK